MKNFGVQQSAVNRSKQWLRRYRLESFIGFVWCISDERAEEVCALAVSFAERVPRTFDSPLWDDVNRRLLGIVQPGLHDEEPMARYAETINDAKRICAGSAFKSDHDIDIDLTCQSGKLSLPHWSRTLVIGEGTEQLRLKKRKSRCLVNGMDVRDLEFIEPIHLRVGGQEFSILVEEPIYQKWVESDPLGIGLQAESKNAFDPKPWIKAARQADFIANRFCPDLASEIAPFLSDVVPIPCVNEGESLSSSSRDMIGAVMASPVIGYEFIEMLLHENAHSHLNILMKMSAFVTDNRPIFYSPMRTDVRPMSGLLHAFYSFAPVANYYALLCRDKRLEGTFLRRYSEIVLTLDVLSHSLVNSQFLTDRGKKFVTRLCLDLSKLSGRKTVLLPDDILRNQIRHFEQFCDTYRGELNVDYLRDLKHYLNSKMTKVRSKRIDESFSPVNWFPPGLTIETPFGEVGPFIVKGLRLFSNDCLSKEEIHNHLGNKQADVIDIESHRGDGHTVLISEKIVSYLHDLNDKSSKLYLGEHCINNWPGVVPTDQVGAILKKFFINNDQLLLFLNKKGRRVKLHNDSGNNFHFNIWGRKTLFLISPIAKTEFYEATQGYGEGFSPIDPFEDCADKYPQFDLSQGKCVILEKNDCLFIPTGWWHAVHYDDESCSVSCFDQY